MTDKLSPQRDRIYVIVGLGIALIVAFFLSPFASPDPDGLDRVSQDLKFSDRQMPHPPAKHLPFAAFFEGYALKGVPQGAATPLAGAIGTLATFALAWGMGKLVTSLRERKQGTGNGQQSD
jgi:cobalt/nickel transport protein